MQDGDEKSLQIEKGTQALLSMNLALGSTTDLTELLELLICCATDLLDAERATVYLYDAGPKELYTHIAKGTEGFRMSIDTGIAGAVARDMAIINIPDAYADPRFNPEIDKKTQYRTRNLLTLPLTDYNGALVGVLQLLNKRSGPFGEADIVLARAFAAQAGVAIQRAHLVDEFLEKQRLEDALRVANEIQQELFPRQSPPVKGFDVACWNRPCDAIGGDYCDLRSLDDNRLIVSMGDVTGHGVGPALVSCASRAMLRALTIAHEGIEEAMLNVNKLLNEDLATGKFVTAFLGMLDGSAGTLSYCSAGQGPLLWLHAATDDVECLGAEGLPLGILPDVDELPPMTLAMQSGDIFALLTDGFYEWARADGELFGSDRVSELMRQHKAFSAEDILGKIRENVESFAQTDQADDLTAILVKRL